MDKVFSFRLDDLTFEKLRSLATQSYRTRGSLLRLLILNADVQNDLVPPKVGDTSRITDHLTRVESEKELES